MTQFNVIREVEVLNQKATSAADLYITSEKGIVKSFNDKDEARAYLSKLYKRAFQNKCFEEVKRVGKDRINCHRADDKCFIFVIRSSKKSNR